MIVLESGLTSAYGPNNPRVLWNNVAFAATVTASSAAAGFAAVNAATAIETTAWKATGTSSDEWIEITLGTAAGLTAAAVAAHDLASQDATARIEYHNGTAWVQIGVDITPTSNRPFALLFDAVTATRFRLVIASGASAPCRVGCLFFGSALEFPQRVFVDQGAPFDLGVVTEYNENMTIGGRYAGRSIRRQREQSELTLRDIREGWVQDNMRGFIEYARQYPYFLLPRPSDYPNNIGYKWLNRDIRTTRTGVAGDMVEFAL